MLRGESEKGLSVYISKEVIRLSFALTFCCNLGKLKFIHCFLMFQIESNETLDITDYKGTPVGKMSVSILLC